jgi:hypothetical protein
VKLFDVPFRLAITDVVVFAATVEIFIEKLALVAPAGSVIEVGIVIAATGVPSFNATSAPKTGAGWLRVTVQVAVPSEKTVAGVHVSALMATAGSRDSEKLAELSLRLAVTISVVAVVVAPTATVKVALTAPAGTVTDAGMVTLAEAATNPNDRVVAVDAFATKVAVQVTVAGVTTVARLHASVFTRFAGTIVSIAPLPADAMPLP